MTRMPFLQKTVNAFEMTKREAACEILASLPDCKAFVAVYPPRPEEGYPQWFIRRFEVPADQTDEYLGEEDLRNSQLLYLNSIEEVESLLLKWGVDPSRLDAPWKCDYPL